MIPTFPNFKKLELSDKEEIEKLTAPYPPYSDFNFTSLYAWDTRGERMISELNGNLVVRFTDYCSNEPFLSFLGVNERAKTARTLIEFASANGLPTTLKLMPEVSIEGLEQEGFTVAEDRDNFDYIYDVKKLSTFADKTLERKRTNLHKLQREHPETHLEIVNSVNTDIRDDVLSVFHIWEKRQIEKGRQIDISNEFVALRRLCETVVRHDLLTTFVSVRGMKVAFSIDEILPAGYTICHFWKADTTCGEIYDLLIQEKSKYFGNLGISAMNYEQDLGIPSLRFAKNSFRPIKMLRKYGAFVGSRKRFQQSQQTKEKDQVYSGILQ